LGLITKEVLIKLRSSNKKHIKHYEDLKYNIPKLEFMGKKFIPRETEILVNVKDLPNNSCAKVNIQCDCCGKILKNIQWMNYLKCVKEDGKYYCRKCAYQLYGNENARKSRFAKSKSFEQWCIENNYQNILDGWDYNLNNCKPSEITYRMSRRYYFKCPIGLHKSELKYIYDLTIGNYNFKCSRCERNESILQKKIRLYLESLNKYIILHEYKCTLKCINPKTKHLLPYDNEIKELKLVIETMGKQHYEIIGFHHLQAKRNNTSPEQELHYQKVKDRYKRMFAKSKINNYHYLEIPYYTDDKDENWKKLIDDKIDYIINLKYIEEKNKVA